MPLCLVQITHLRCIQTLRFAPVRGVNWLIGGNGQGKTSVLEAISMLGTGASFRSGDSLITLGQTQTVVFGALCEPDGQIGVMREQRQRSMKLDGEAISSAWPLLEALPTLAIIPENQQSLRDPPQVRRRMLDWGLFHVEPGYGEILRQYRRCLSQRNARLKQGGGPDLAHWDQNLVHYGEALQASRARYITALSPYFEARLADLTGQSQDAVVLSLQSGWSAQKSLGECLARDLPRDLAQGFTHNGAHRADLLFSWQGQAARELLSRGQSKLWGLAFRLAQLAYLRDQCGKVVTVLLDDFGAELDPAARQRVVDTLLNLQAQVFATVTHEAQIPAMAAQQTGYFYLEAGQLVANEGTST